jgi:phytoene synthase
VGFVTIGILGCRDHAARGPALDLGTAMQMTNILRDVREDLERDRVYLPADEMARFGVSESDLARAQGGAAFAALVRFEAERTRRLFASGSRLDALLEPRPRLVPRALSAIYGAILGRIEQDPGRVLVERVSLGAVEKGLLAARVLLGAAGDKAEGLG